MKRFLSILLFFLVLHVYCVAEEQNGSKSYSQTTEKEITFLSIPWGASLKSVTNAIESSSISIIEKKTQNRPGYDYDSLMDFAESYNFHDPSGEVFPYLKSEEVKTTLVKYDCSCTIAGYKVNNITLTFMNEENFGLFEAEYHFYTYYTPKNYTCEDEYHDLKQKLTDLYGAPYEYENSGFSIFGNRDYKRSIWKGANTTGIILEYENYTSGTLKGVLSLNLTYGTGEVDRIFIEKNKEKELREEREKQQQLEIIHNDNTGL